MDRLVYHNDRIISAAEASVPAMLAGVLYGWGVFTTARVYDGSVFALDRHWERLSRHAEKIGIEIPLNLDRCREALNELLSSNGTREGRARITVLKGDAGGWRTANVRGSELFIFTSSEPTRPAVTHTITLSPYRLLSSGPLAGIKRTAMLEHLLALEEARSRGFTEVVMLNERGEIVSAAAANIFWIEKDEIFTPSLGTGCIAGVTRGLVYEIARRMNMHLSEGSFPLKRLLSAREVFLTSSTREIVSVTGYDMKEYSRRQARMTKVISREFQKITRDVRISL
jgi:branched-subunit amino acid aminotransferase/4-amino-4-deoxychorismate lyase